MFMLVTEQLLPGAHSHPGSFIPGSGLLSPKASTVEFDADIELGEPGEDSGRSPRATMQRSASTSAQRPTTPRSATVDGFKIPTPGKGLALTLGLVLHALSDGLALGSSIASDTGSQELSSVIFAALIIHKGMTTIRFCRMSGIYLTRMAYSAHRTRPHDLFVGEWDKPDRLQKFPRDIQRLYTYRRHPHLFLLVALPVRGWRQEPLDRGCYACFCTPRYRLSFVMFSN